MTTPIDPDRHHVHVEVVALSLLEDRLAHRRVVDHLHDAETPDAAAARIAGLDPDDGGLVHSTSWRHTPDALVLTYVVAPDPAPTDDRAVLADDATITHAADPHQPGAGAGVTAEAVVAHACRHLALLHDTDPGVRRVAGTAPALWRTIRARGLALAGQLPASLQQVR